MVLEEGFEPITYADFKFADSTFGLPQHLRNGAQGGIRTLKNSAV